MDINTIQEFEKRIDSRVSWTTFAWALGIVLAVVFGLVGWINVAASTSQRALEKANMVDTRTAAQFDEIMRSLSRIEKATGISK